MLNDYFLEIFEDFRTSTELRFIKKTVNCLPSRMKLFPGVYDHVIGFSESSSFHSSSFFFVKDSQKPASITDFNGTNFSVSSSIISQE